MSDEQTRTLERAQDGTRLLAARVRDGTLSFARVEWAARLGDERALAVVGRLAKPTITWEVWWDRRYAIRGVAEAVGGLDYKKTVVAFACDCAERVLPIFEARHPSDLRPRKAIEAARAWIACPGPVDDGLRLAARSASNEAWNARDASGAAAAAAAAAAAGASDAASGASDADAAAYAAYADADADADAAAAAAAAAAGASDAAAAAARTQGLEKSRARLIAYALGEVNL